MNTQFEDLIAKHLHGTLREEEKQQLAVLLKDPEHQLYLASKIDEKFFDEALVEEGEEAMGAFLLQQIRERMPEKVQPPVQPRREPSAVPLKWYRNVAFRRLAAAAAAIVLILTSVLLWNNRSQERSMAVQNGRRQADSTRSVVRHEVNGTGKEKRIPLQDGSLVVLADKSELTYREPFGDRRDITLKGKAFFKVARDAARPFTVISGAIATTALGTEFTVTAFENKRHIIVRLYEGKVVVREVGKGGGQLKSDVYLRPGQEFVYGSQTTAKVKAFQTKAASPEAIMGEERFQDDPSLPQNIKGSWYMFNNQSLAQVFDQLSAMFQVQIIYDNKDVQNIYFTGRYNPSDSLGLILRDIGVLHDLTITKKENGYLISR